MSLFEPTIQDLQAAVDALKDQLADADRENRCLRQRVSDLEEQLAVAIAERR